MAWELLFKSNIGLASLFVIVFIIAMAVWFARYFLRKIDEDARQAKAANTAASSTHRK